MKNHSGINKKGTCYTLLQKRQKCCRATSFDCFSLLAIYWLQVNNCWESMNQKLSAAQNPYRGSLLAII